MQTLKYFFKILRGHILSVAIFLALFLGLAILLTEFGGDIMDDFSASTFNITVTNRDASHSISQGLVDYLDSLHTLLPLEDDLATKQTALFFQDTLYVLIIEEGFGAAFYENPAAPAITLSNIPSTSGNAGQFINRQIDNFMITLRAYLTAGFALDHALSLAINPPAANVQLLRQEDNAGGASPYFQLLPFAAISVTILALGSVLVVYKRDNLVRRIDVSSTPSVSIKASIMLACTLCAFVIWLVFMAGGHVFGAEPIYSEIGIYRALNAIALIAFAVAAAFLIGQFVRKTVTLQAIVQVIALGFSFIAGVFVPQEFLGEGVLAAARFTPTYWYVRSNDMLNTASAANPVDMGILLQGIGIQVAFAVALFAVALALGREKRAKA